MGSGTAAEYSSRVGPGYPRNPSGAAGVPPQTLAGRSAGRWHGGGQGFESPQLHQSVLTPTPAMRHAWSGRFRSSEGPGPRARTFCVSEPSVDYSKTEPANKAVQVSIWFSDSANWTSWSPVTSGSPLTGVTWRYLQYKAVLTGTNSATPTLDDIQVDYMSPNAPESKANVRLTGGSGSPRSYSAIRANASLA
jgi:hypothetical protein